MMFPNSAFQGRRVGGDSAIQEAGRLARGAREEMRVRARMRDVPERGGRVLRSIVRRFKSTGGDRWAEGVSDRMAPRMIARGRVVSQWSMKQMQVGSRLAEPIGSAVRRLAPVVAAALAMTGLRWGQRLGLVRRRRRFPFVRETLEWAGPQTDEIGRALAEARLTQQVRGFVEESAPRLRTSGREVGRAVGGQAGQIAGVAAETVRGMGAAAQGFVDEASPRMVARGRELGRALGEQAGQLGGVAAETVRRVGPDASDRLAKVGSAAAQRLTPRARQLGDSLGKAAVVVPTVGQVGRTMGESMVSGAGQVGGTIAAVLGAVLSAVWGFLWATIRMALFLGVAGAFILYVYRPERVQRQAFYRGVGRFWRGLLDLAGTAQRQYDQYVAPNVLRFRQRTDRQAG